MLKFLKMYYVFVGLPYVLLLAGSWYFFEPIKRTILNNPIPHLNYAIIVIVLIGGVLILINARRLVREARILGEFSGAIHAKTDSTTLREMADKYTGDLACILQMVSSSGDRSISHQEQAALEHELGNARSRLIRRNALPQYLTGLLVAMGLLGTFIGLLATLADISILISSFADIDMANIDPIQVFRVMIERMKAPMSSMGIAFSTSMFGLLGSIVIGLMMVGIRRLQGDIFSVLSSELARHIETALSFESISFRGGEVVSEDSGYSVDLTAKILLRIEERLTESARLRQRALSSEIDDFKKQRAEMLHVLSEQTEASNNFLSELQQLGRQLGTIFNSMEKSNVEISTQVSDLTVHMAGDAKESHKLLAMQVEEQKKLRDTFDSYNIEERLAEASRLQQRALSSEIEDFRNQRADMLRALTEQTEANNNFRSDLQQFGSQLGTIFNRMETGSDEISSQISELTIHVSADAKESHRLLNITSNNLRNELQKLGSTISNVTEKGNEEVCAQVSELMAHVDTEVKASQQMLDRVSSDIRTELQQHGSQLSNVTEKGKEEICNQLSDLMTQFAVDSKESQQLLDNESTKVRSELKELGRLLSSHIDTIFNVTEKGNVELTSQVSDLMAHMIGDTKESHAQRVEMLSTLVEQAKVSDASCSELQQLGSQLGVICNEIEKGNGEITSQLSELTMRMDDKTEES